MNNCVANSTVISNKIRHAAEGESPAREVAQPFVVKSRPGAVSSKGRQLSRALEAQRLAEQLAEEAATHRRRSQTPARAPVEHRALLYISVVLTAVILALMVAVAFKLK